MLLINSSEELRQLTGNYYANNDFSKVVGDIEQATEELTELVGEKVMELAAAGENTELLKKVQRPIAILATLRLYRKNDLSHEDDGRKFKVSTDGTDKLPWEWQLDRDDAMHLEEYYRAVDALIRYLNKTNLKEWTDSDTYIETQKLIIRSGRELSRYFPTEGSERLYLMLVPFIREVQTRTVSRAYGEKWPELLGRSTLCRLDGRSFTGYVYCFASSAPPGFPDGRSPGLSGRERHEWQPGSVAGRRGSNRRMDGRRRRTLA